MPQSPRPFELVTLDEVGKRADAADKDVHFIHIDATFAKDGQHASVSHGVGLELPKKQNAIKLCCCTATRAFDRRGGRWHASDVHMMSCS